MNHTPLMACIAAETSEPVPAPVEALYAAFCAGMQRPQGAYAGLFYGSALWKPAAPDSVWDLYVLVASYRDVSRRPLLRIAGTCLPPNVYYQEITQPDGTVLRGKIAVMTFTQFRRHCAGRVLAPQTWARFAQPARLIAAANEPVRAQVMESLAQAVITFHRATAPWLSAPLSIDAFWQCGLTQTYASEFRAERSNRQQHLVAAWQAVFLARSSAALAGNHSLPLTLVDGHITSTLTLSQARVRRIYQRGRNMLSKAQHVLRLIKAALTFAGGLDYLVYKIARHSGVTLTPSAFARAYPLLGVWPLFIKGWRAGAFR